MKRITALILALIMICAAVSSCGRTEGGEEDVKKEINAGDYSILVPAVGSECLMYSA